MYAQVARDGPKETPTLASGHWDRGIVTTDRNSARPEVHVVYVSACGVFFFFS